MKRSDERPQPPCDLYAPLSPDEFECLRQFASEFGDSLVLDKTMPRFPQLKKLVELGFIGREGEEYYVTRFARMRINQGH
jgi:hypothetical protein